MPINHRHATAGFAALLLGTAINLTAAHAAPADRTTLNQQVMTTLQQCQQVSVSCSETTTHAKGVLVFPTVTKASFIVGGQGGEGALVENGKITGYYNLGAASAGLQAGIENNSQVYVFRTADALATLKNSPNWKADASAGVTVVTADANAKGVSSANVLAYVFDSKGLHGGVSLGVMDVWKDGNKRPASM